MDIGQIFEIHPLWWFGAGLLIGYLLRGQLGKVRSKRPGRYHQTRQVTENFSYRLNKPVELLESKLDSSLEWTDTTIGSLNPGRMVNIAIDPEQ